jgi:hypothetical protein
MLSYQKSIELGPYLLLKNGNEGEDSQTGMEQLD